MTDPDPDDREPGPGGLSWVQIVAGALAAVSSAVLLSTLGVAGTVIGAALGSVVATIASAVYTRGLETSRQRVAAQAAAVRRVASARDHLDRAASRIDDPVAEDRIDRAERALAGAERALDDGGPEGAPVVVPDRRRLPWRRVALVAGGLFLAAMVAISAFELVAGRSVSELTGGSSGRGDTTVPGLRRERTDPTPSPTPTSTTTPSDEPSPTPTVEPTPTATAEPTPTPEPTTELPTPTLTPTDTPTDPG